MAYKLTSGAQDLTAKLIGSIRVHILPVIPGNAIDGHVYALNWFDTRWQWLYGFYNLLGEKSVRRVGGKAIFKGRTAETIYSSSAAEHSDRRDMLLIVRYPAVDAFRNMLESKYFQFVSLLRMFATRQFSFAFSRSLVNIIVGHKDQDLPSVYIVHHFRMNNEISDNSLSQMQAHTQRATDIAKENSVSLCFSSEVMARLHLQKGESPTEAVATIMDGCMIFRAQDKNDLIAMVESNAYRKIISGTQSSFLAFIDRVL